MNKIKYATIWLLDKVDHHILRHRFHSLCCKIGGSHWWDPNNYWECSCKKKNPLEFDSCIKCNKVRPWQELWFKSETDATMNFDFTSEGAFYPAEKAKLRWFRSNHAQMEHSSTQWPTWFVSFQAQSAHTTNQMIEMTGIVILEKLTFQPLCRYYFSNMVYEPENGILQIVENVPNYRSSMANILKDAKIVSFYSVE